MSECANVDDMITRGWAGYLETPNSMELIDIRGTEFKEFCEALEELDRYGDIEPYVEAVDDSNLKKGAAGSKAIQRTAETTRDIGQAYKRTTDAGGGLLYNTWKLIMAGINLIVKVSSFILNNLSKIPKLILALARKVGSIPTAVKRKIRGDIALYITADDIASIYNNSILSKLELFMSEMRVLTKGDMWSTVFNRRLNISKNALNPKNKTEQIFENDMKTCRRMEKVYLQLANVRFEKSTVVIKDESVQDIYFGQSATIKLQIPRPLVKDATPDPDAGTVKTFTYLGAMQRLIKDLGKFSDEITELHKDLNDKYQHTMDESSFRELSGLSRNRVTNTIQMISKVIALIGNVIKYASTDIDTINKSVATIEKLNQKRAYKDADPATRYRMRQDEKENRRQAVNDAKDDIKQKVSDKKQQFADKRKERQQQREDLKQAKQEYREKRKNDRNGNS